MNVIRLLSVGPLLFDQGYRRYCSPRNWRRWTFLRWLDRLESLQATCTAATAGSGSRFYCTDAAIYSHAEQPSRACLTMPLPFWLRSLHPVQQKKAQSWSVEVAREQTKFTYASLGIRGPFVVEVVVLFFRRGGVKRGEKQEDDTERILEKCSSHYPVVRVLMSCKR